jgi:tRNA G10  N-methylase Trm11
MVNILKVTMKKNRYFACFAPGMQFIVKDILEKKISDVNICQLFDGAVLFETVKIYDSLSLYCFNNIFSVITFAKKKEGGIESFIRQIVNSGFQNEIIQNDKKSKTFRIIVSSKNQLVSIDNSLKTKLENIISLQSKLKLNRSNPDVEFWVLYRTEGFCYFMKRLSRHTAYEKILNKGELHPEIAFLMNWLAEPDRGDTVLDPFCGNGAIPLKRAMAFPAKQIYAFDIDKNMIGIVKRKTIEKNFLAKRKNIIIKQVDVKYLDKELSQESVDKIVTDPPWGLFENMKAGINEFYSLALSKMEEILKNKGIIVLLIGRDIDIETLIKPLPTLSLEQNYNVLVSGKKANLVKLKKHIV